MPSIYLAPKSTTIKAVRYDPVEKTLRVEFHVGDAVTHSDVPQDIFDGFRTCEHCTAYYHVRVKRQFSVVEPSAKSTLQLLCESCAIEEAKKRAKGVAL